MAFKTSDLSQENILRDIHDPVTQTIRTTATAIIPPGLQVDISHIDDSVRLGDGTNFLTSTTITSKNGLDVNVINPISATIPDGSSFSSYPLEKGVTKNTFNEITGVAQGIQTTVAAYTVPVLKHGYLSRIDYSGTNIATYDVQINGMVQDKKRTNYAVSLNDFTNFESNGNTGIPLFAGDIIIVTVLHDRPTVGDFNARILSIEVDN